ncbi:peptidase domain-containing ABC transporter [Azospirillum picis]|uniref:ATP-binding cassette subfamily C protein/ATP-binding cassette subfamily C protein LapB n=1 Tax=Azospirillum picis TaxID=488438 RepID=A0ABU0MMC0_9PROT|nr:ATP-binding cassette domain-containing protein [Azospirillum picis]MBP2300651.1 ATP-binding cassette subfamily C protein/ATP-binding cassette subfamily C protein LapB [Azospirillum picis]MDQ0534620.1 ATP-binding cassette subfamily C protein/ATP-binding cassette subfamily C protein LapB [Azospirillum picis]
MTQILDPDVTGRIMPPVPALSLPTALDTPFRHGPDLTAALLLLLRRLGWVGSPQDITGALPWGSGSDAVTDLRDVAARLGFGSTIHQGRRFPGGELRRILAEAGYRGGAVLYVPSHAGTGEAGLLESSEDGLRLQRPEGPAEPVGDALAAGTLVVAAAAEPDGVVPAPAGERRSWIRSRLAAAGPLIGAALALTLAANLLSLSSPLFVMTIYDKVVAAGSIHLLVALGIGAAGALLIELAMRRLRSRIMAHGGARLGYVVGNAVLARLLHLPSPLTERVAVAAQVARVKDLDRVRDLLTGPLAQACLDLPFAVIFLVAIGILSGWLVLVPLCAIGLYVAAAWLGNAMTRTHVAAAAGAGARRQELLLEIVERMPAIRALGAAKIWSNRYDAVAGRMAEANFRSAQTTTLIATFSQTLTTLTGLATLGFGIDQVLAGSLSTGGLIGTMMLVWRTLSPVQSAFMASTRLGQLRASLRQVETLMATPPERSESVRAERAADIRGQVTFSHVTFRYGREAEPVLANLGFDVAPGEVVAIVGRNGGGKSTLLKLVSGLYSPQGGSVRIDGRDIRQFDPMALRRSIAFVPQVPQFFDGTLAENLRLVAPGASDADLRAALDRAGVLDAVDDLPEGLETRFDTRDAALPAGLLARLSLARTYLRDAPIVLLDEPAASVDFEGEFAFTSTVHAFRGHSTVFFVTHRRSHLAMADKVLIIENGTSRYFGPAEKVRDRIPKGMI